MLLPKVISNLVRHAFFIFLASSATVVSGPPQPAMSLLARSAGSISILLGMRSRLINALNTWGFIVTSLQTPGSSAKFSSGKLFQSRWLLSIIGQKRNGNGTVGDMSISDICREGDTFVGDAGVGLNSNAIVGDTRESRKKLCVDGV